jgi:acyl carrier protein
VNQNDICAAVKEFIQKEIAADGSADEIDDTTPLISGGILNSLATLQLVTFLEDTYDVSIKAREVGIDYMDSLNDIAKLVLSKRQ